jgi:hypothetical protein
MPNDFLGLAKEDPPAESMPAFCPDAQSIAAVLDANVGESFIVSRSRHYSDIVNLADRITGGREYGNGYEAVYRQVGHEHRVYAWKKGN